MNPGRMARWRGNFNRLVLLIFFTGIFYPLRLSAVSPKVGDLLDLVILIKHLGLADIYNIAS